jgi:iron-sulfur cluster assembly protein
MLAVTSSAAAAIRDITGAIPAAAGIRLAPLPGLPMNGSKAETQLEAQPAPAPDAADEVLEEEGASLFIEPSLIPHLDDKVLDVEMEGVQATFVLSPQG